MIIKLKKGKIKETYIDIFPNLSSYLNIFHISLAAAPAAPAVPAAQAAPVEVAAPPPPPPPAEKPKKKTVIAPPEFVKLVEPARFSEGQPGRFSCQVSGEPKPEITWYRDGQEIETGYR